MATTTSAQKSAGTQWLQKQTTRIGDGGEIKVSEVEAVTSQVERWLQGHGVQYAPPLEIPMVLIDEKRSRLNQARRDAIVTDSVDRFAASMKAGEVFPPIVAFINGGRLVIIDGNNRQAGAKKAGRDTILGIVIAEDTPSELIQLLTVEANAHHGVTPELSWRLMQAFQLINLGFSDQQAAQAAAVTVQQIQVARRVQDVDARARKLQIRGFTEALPTYTRQHLSALKDAPVFFQAAKLAVDTRMTGDEVRDLIRGVKQQDSESAKIAYIGKIAEERGIQAATQRAAGKVAHRLTSPKVNLLAGVGKLLALDEAALVRNIATSYELQLVKTKVKELEDKVLALQVALETVQVEDE